MSSLNALTSKNRLFTALCLILVVISTGCAPRDINPQSTLLDARQLEAGQALAGEALAATPVQAGAEEEEAAQEAVAEEVTKQEVEQ